MSVVVWYNCDLWINVHHFLQSFDTVVDLVEYHKAEPLVLKSGGETTLKFECPQ